MSTHTYIIKATYQGVKSKPTSKIKTVKSSIVLCSFNGFIFKIIVVRSAIVLKATSIIVVFRIAWVQVIVKPSKTQRYTYGKD